MPRDAFAELVAQYELSKTLRFELKPIGSTPDMLKRDDVFEKDRLLRERYEKTKPYFDRMHREFVNEALEGMVLSGLEDYDRALKGWQSDRKNKSAAKDLKACESSLRSQVLATFDAAARQWAERYPNCNLKKGNIEILFEEGIFNVIKERYGSESESTVFDNTAKEDVSIFDSWKGFIGYFDKFFATRKNFYSDDGKATAIATRIVDQNLRRFCDNLRVFEQILQKVDLSELGESVKRVFSLKEYNGCLLQGGIDAYNEIIGGKVLGDGTKIRGINELVNKYRQDHKGEKIPFLKRLDRQILSEKERFFDEIESDEEFLALLRAFHGEAEARIGILKNLIGDLVANSGTYDFTKIYISREAFNTISYRWTAATRHFEAALYDAMKTDKPDGLKHEKKDDSYAFPDFIALGYIKNALESLPSEVSSRFWKESYYKSDDASSVKHVTDRPLSGDEPIWNQFLYILGYEFGRLYESVRVDQESGAIEQIGYAPYEKRIRVLLNGEISDIANIERKIIVKNFADATLGCYQMGKYFAVEKTVEKRRMWQDQYDLDAFYTRPVDGYLAFYDGAYAAIVQAYNKFRNYLSRKPYSESKWKLNFENPTLADGFDRNKEKDNFAVLLRRGGEYFLGIMRKGSNDLFDDRHADEFLQGVENGSYEKMAYKFFPDPSKMMPKVCFSDKNIDSFAPTSEVMRIYEKKEYKKGDTYSLESMRRLIDFYKAALGKYDGWKGYDFVRMKPTSAYREYIGEFFHDVAEDGYRLSFQGVSADYVDRMNHEGKLYLFQIKNKDWNEGSNGARNLHTLYFESLFSKENAGANFPMKLNGQAELFFRPKSIEAKEKSVTPKNGGEKFERPIIENRRYTEDKIFFHVPMTMNRNKGGVFGFNPRVNDMLAGNPDINVIGVDRGEKHLIYYSVVSRDGDILDGGSLNTIDGGNQTVDYAEKLRERAVKRERARRDWQDVEGIKNLKKGYISQVVRKLADLAIEHNAIIVLEDLNMRFKQIRGGIEKSVYQQLEKALIEKLQFLVAKGEKNPKMAGHLLRAYQLTAPFESFQKMGKQTGILFYTQAGYTSKIDPLTGWRPNLYLRYSNAEEAKRNISKFSKIVFADGRFEFTYDLKSFGMQNEYPRDTQWTVCSCVERYRWNPNKRGRGLGGYDHYENLTDDYHALFQKWNIDPAGDIRSQIDTIDANDKNNASFFRDFYALWNLLCQIRNTDTDALTGTDTNDFILSPVEPFFDSRRAIDFENKYKKTLPKNGDENGAYNIARKGTLILDKIVAFSKKNGGCAKFGWSDAYISLTDWDDFARRHGI